ncbi:MAG: hydantoinase/oxoprolinase family protein, partial [Candidatus Rokuibacteriota bacterium]
WGLLDTDIRTSFSRTAGPAARHATGDRADLTDVEGAWAELEVQGRAWLDAEEVPRERQRLERSADLRYQHQSFELTCPLGEGPVTRERLAALVDTFHREHRRLYTYDLPSATVELVNLRVTAIGQLPQRARPAATPSGSDTASARIGQREVYFARGGRLATACYARAKLTSGMTFDGPALVDQEDATVLVSPGFRARVDHAHNVILQSQASVEDPAK